MFQQMMASLLGTKRQLEGGRVLRREGSAPAGFSKLGRLLQPMLRASVAVAAFVTLPALAGNLNDTGITACGDAVTTSANCAIVSADGGSFPRQDGRYGAGAGFNFTKIANDGTELSGSVALGTSAKDWACTRDNVTGLMWEVKTSSGLRSQSHTYKWYQSGSGVASKNSEPSTCQTAGHCDTDQFVTDVNKEGLCGVSNGWRMPTVKELENIVDFGRNNPSVDTTYFPNTLPGDYWSGTNNAASPGVVAWNVSFVDGIVGGRMTSNLASVRLVWGTQDTSTYTSETLLNGDTVVTDSRTGLMWKREHEMLDPSQPNDWQTRINALSWQEALQRAVNDRTGGYSDWRLPNIRELRSLVDESRSRPAIDPKFLPPPFQGWFWSSSPYMGTPGVSDLSMPVYFDVGSDAIAGREFRQYARLVRGGGNFDKFGGTVSLSGSSLTFAPQSLNTTSAAQPLTLSNTGSGSITITGIAVSAGDYTIQTNNCPATLAPGLSCTINVTFTPSVAGPSTGTVTIASNAPGSPHPVSLSGSGAVVAGVSLNPGALVFGTPQGLNTSATQTITLGNTGSNPITGIGITASAGDYSQTNTCDATLAPGGSCTIEVSFKPTAVGSRTGIITITSSAVGNPHRVSLTGTGVVILHRLTVTKLGTGTGTVSASSNAASNINCGTTCNVDYPAGTIVTLRAVGIGSTFDGWNGANCPTSGDCVVSMTEARSVTATFTANTVSGHLLTVEKLGTGSGKITSSPASIDCGALCSALQNTGLKVTLTALADQGSAFTGWSGACSNMGPCEVTMNDPLKVSATFTANTVTRHMLNVNKSGTGTGTVSASSNAASNINCGTTCSVDYPAGTSVTLSAVAVPGSAFTGWSGACSGMGPCAPYMNQQVNVTATFTADGSANSYTLTVLEQGTGKGTITSSPTGIDCGALCSASFPKGGSVTLTAKATEGSTFTGWTGANCSGPSSSCEVPMTEAHTVTANFTLTPVPSAILFDGIYLWAEGEYLSLHRRPANTLVATIYRVHTADTLTVGTLSSTATDTFNLLSEGTINGATATISGTGFFRACKLNYKLELNDDSSLKVTSTGVSNNTGVSVAEVDCAAKFTPLGTTWTIRREH